MNLSPLCLLRATCRSSSTVLVAEEMHKGRAATVTQKTGLSECRRPVRERSDVAQRSWGTKVAAPVCVCGWGGGGGRQNALFYIHTFCNQRSVCASLLPRLILINSGSTAQKSQSQCKGGIIFYAVSDDWCFEATLNDTCELIILIDVTCYYNQNLINVWPHSSDATAEDRWFKFPLGRDIFCLKHFDTCPRTSVGESVACAQLTFQMSTI